MLRCKDDVANVSEGLDQPNTTYQLLFVATGYNTPTVIAIRPDGSGDVTDTHGFLETLERVLPGSKQYLSASGGDLPVTQRLDDAALRADYPGLLRIPLEQGLSETVEVFQRLGQQGKLEACL